MAAPPPVVPGPVGRPAGLPDLVLLGLVAVLALLAPLALPRPLAAERVLFVGNSFTRNLGGVGTQVERMARALGLSLKAGEAAVGGFSFEDHFERPEGARESLATGGWDRVVLQEQSGRPLFAPELFERYGRLLVAEARSAGARPLLYMTWAREPFPEEQADLTDAYCRLARGLGVDLAPVGAAWQRARQLDPDLTLHASDGVHANREGLYLNALVIFGALTGEDPRQVPPSLETSLFIRPADGETLRAVAAEILDGHRRGQVCGTALELGSGAQAGRFRVEVAFRVAPGLEEPGRPAPPLSGGSAGPIFGESERREDTGAFWFFDPDNLELVVKVLDGRPVNGFFWVFYGSLTDVEFRLTITDTVTGRQRVYDNPAGHMASFADVRAFP